MHTININTKLLKTIHSHFHLTNYSKQLIYFERPTMRADASFLRHFYHIHILIHKLSLRLLFLQLIIKTFSLFFKLCLIFTTDSRFCVVI